MRSTHTYVVLDISPEAHADIKAKFLAAGYGHSIDGDTIDMHGIALEPKEAQGTHHCHCDAVHRCPIMVHPDPVVHECLSNLVEAMSKYDSQSGSKSRVTMHSDHIHGIFHSHTFNDSDAVIPVKPE